MNITTEKKDGGVIKHLITGNKGGTINLTIFTEGNKSLSIGYSNGKGLAYFKEALTSEEINEEIKSIKKVKYLNKGEKYCVIDIIKKHFNN